MSINISKQIKIASKNRGVSYAFLIVLGVMQALLTVVFALSVKNIINAVEYNLGINDILYSAIILILCVVLLFVANLVYKILLAKCQTKVETNIKSYVFKKFINGSFSNISKNHTGDLLSRLNNDVQNVASVHVGLIPSLIATIVQLVSIICVLAILQLIFTIIIVGAGLVVFFVTYSIRYITAKLHLRTRKKDGEVNNFFTESLQNALVVKAFNAEEHISNLGDNFLTKLKNAKLKQRYFNACVSSMTGLLFTLFYAVTVVWGSYGIANNVLGIDFGVIVAMLQLVQQIRSPLGSISGFVTVYTEMQVSANRLFEITNEGEIENKISVNANDFKNIEIENASFGYGDEKVIDNASLLINKGDKVLIKGRSGIGKSTLIKLIIGLYSPNEGKVVINGVSSNNATNSKGVFSLVPQGNMLFAGTLKENLTFASSNASNEDILSALKIACVDDMIDELPNGIDSVIGEKGSTLSEGQAQRVAIARAILAKTPVIILDEATSALDEKTEKRVIENLSKLDDVTIISISHKMQIEKICNKVYTIENGSLKQV